MIVVMKSIGTNSGDCKRLHLYENRLCQSNKVTLSISSAKHLECTWGTSNERIPSLMVSLYRYIPSNKLRGNDKILDSGVGVSGTFLIAAYTFVLEPDQERRYIPRMVHPDSENLVEQGLLKGCNHCHELFSYKG